MPAENKPRQKGQKGVLQLQDFKYNSVEKIQEPEGYSTEISKQGI